MLNIISHQGNIIHNHKKIILHTFRVIVIIQKIQIYQMLEQQNSHSIAGDSLVVKRTFITWPNNHIPRYLLK